MIRQTAEDGVSRFVLCINASCVFMSLLCLWPLRKGVTRPPSIDARDYQGVLETWWYFLCYGNALSVVVLLLSLRILYMGNSSKKLVWGVVLLQPIVAIISIIAWIIQ